MRTHNGRILNLEFPYYLRHVPSGKAYTGNAGPEGPNFWLSDIPWDRFTFTEAGAYRKQAIFTKMGHQFDVVRS